MERKKNSGFDLERKRTVFFQIGLLTVSSFTLAAFTYRNPIERVTITKDTDYQIVEYHEANIEEAEETKLEITPNQSQQQQQTSIDLNVLPDEHSKTKTNTGDLPDPKLGFQDLGYPFNDFVVIGGDPEFDDEIFEHTDLDARYVGGHGEMVKYINNVIKYPEISQQFGEQGTVFVSFVVEKDGSVTNVEIERGVSADLDKEAKRIVRSFPDWLPGEYQFKKVRTRVRLPIHFELAEQ